MSNKLCDILSQYTRQDFAIKIGRETHAKLQKIIIDKDILKGDKELCKKISEHNELLQFFNKNSRTEVPIAGYINDRFVSRRIDRLIINDENKSVYILDYKTDTSKDLFYDKYYAQIKEYAVLLKDIYPNYKIHGYLLWVSDFTLEKIL